MIFAQIKNELVNNTIVLNDLDDLHLFTAGFDYVLQIDQLYPRPGIGWSFDGIQFHPPASDSQGEGDTSQSDFQESVTSLTTISAPVDVDALMTNMSLTPGSGQYLVFFSSDISSSIAGATISVSIYVNGVQVPGTLRKVIPYAGGALSTPPGREVVAINQTVIAGETDEIEVWWSTSNTGPTTSSRTLTILRI